jgi:protein gp37
VWLATTAENQEQLEIRWRSLRAIEAVVRFISYEPALAPLTLPTDVPPDWIIAGGESGGGARPPRPEWFRNIRDQCAALGIAFHFKQWGEWIGEGETRANGTRCDEQDGRMHEWPQGGASVRIGAKRAGRLLDRKEHLAIAKPRL